MKPKALAVDMAPKIKDPRSPSISRSLPISPQQPALSSRGSTQVFSFEIPKHYQKTEAIREKVRGLTDDTQEQKEEPLHVLLKGYKSAKSALERDDILKFIEDFAAATQGISHVSPEKDSVITSPYSPRRYTCLGIRCNLHAKDKKEEKTIYEHFLEAMKIPEREHEHLGRLAIALVNMKENHGILFNHRYKAHVDRKESHMLTSVFDSAIPQYIHTAIDTEQRQCDYEKARRKSIEEKSEVKEDVKEDTAREAIRLIVGKISPREYDNLGTWFFFGIPIRCTPETKKEILRIEKDGSIISSVDKFAEIKKMIDERKQITYSVYCLFGKKRHERVEYLQNSISQHNAQGVIDDIRTNGVNF